MYSFHSLSLILFNFGSVVSSWLKAHCIFLPRQDHGPLDYKRHKLVYGFTAKYDKKRSINGEN